MCCPRNFFESNTFRELQAQYVKSLPARIQSLKTLIQERRWTGAIEQLHRMSGSGATYDVPEITSVAKDLEEYLHQHIRPDLTVVETSILALETVAKQALLKLRTPQQ